MSERGLEGKASGITKGCGYFLEFVVHPLLEAGVIMLCGILLIGGG